MADNWRYQFPSANVQWKFKGNEASAVMFTGEANKLLCQVKNRMRLGQLNDLRAVRYFIDGTTITVRSLFGQDFIEINTPVAVSAPIPSCSITLLNVPTVIQPMRWYVDGIHEGEVEGIDYIKTYYSFSTENCDDCPDPDFTICDSDELGEDAETGMTGEKRCLPFSYRDTPTAEITSHCIYSMSGCQAEIIKSKEGDEEEENYFHSDKGGAYFLWKTYTEWTNLGPTGVTFSQNGLGQLLLKAFIEYDSQELCASEESIVTVDCCHKAAAYRVPIMYWDKNCVVSELCPVPTELDYNSLSPYVDNYFWAQPIYGSCIPYKWTLSGQGTLNATGTYNQMAEFIASADLDCHATLVITLADRCNSTYTITQESCCEGAAALTLGYTTLAMSCSGVQTLTASGGCAPYSWNASFGTIVPSEDTTQATYTAPATNAECTSNPTISLSDCCGLSDSIQIAVNCYGAADLAYVQYHWVYDSVSATACLGQYIYYYYLWMSRYKCDGTLLGSASVQGTPTAFHGNTIICGGANRCEPGKEGVAGVMDCAPSVPYRCGVSGSVATGCACTEPGWDMGLINVATNSFFGCEVITPCENDVLDVRTAAMKTAGCCPLNPLTGLPF